MRSLLVLLALAVTLSGCVGPGAVRGLRPDAGTEVRYAAPPQRVLAALPSVLKAEGFSVEPSVRFDSMTTMLVGAKANSLFSYGGFVRVLVQRGEVPGRTSAHFVTRRRAVFDLSGSTDRYVPRVTAALDASLGPDALGPFSGMRVRGRSTERPGPVIVGTVERSADGTLRLIPAAGRPVPLTALSEVAISRGSYGHDQVGGILGFLAGAITGALIARSSNANPSAGMVAMVLGGTIGEFAGFVVGASIRTEVWSPVGPTQPARRTASR